MITEIQEGWDSVVLDVGGEWIVRLPRREEVRESIRREVGLLAELGPSLPVPVPGVEAFRDTDEGAYVAYRKLPGKPLRDPSPSVATELGRFLAALHGFRPSVELPPQQEYVERFVREVLPLLDANERARAERMFAGRVRGPEPVLLHGDLGPAHILHDGTGVTGVIDWSDACLGDPALDFAWLLNGTIDSFGTDLLSAYGGERRTDPSLRERALYYHRIGPWHEVLFGLKHDRRELVKSGLAGIRARLP